MERTRTSETASRPPAGRARLPSPSPTGPVWCSRNTRRRHGGDQIPRHVNRRQWGDLPVRAYCHRPPAGPCDLVVGHHLGTPTLAGTYNPTITATDSSKPAMAGTETPTIVVAQGSPTLDPFGQSRIAPGLGDHSHLDGQNHRDGRRQPDQGHVSLSSDGQDTPASPPGRQERADLHDDGGTGGDGRPQPGGNGGGRRQLQRRDFGAPALPGQGARPPPLVRGKPVSKRRGGRSPCPTRSHLEIVVIDEHTAWRRVPPDVRDANRVVLPVLVVVRHVIQVVTTGSISQAGSDGSRTCNWRRWSSGRRPRSLSRSPADATNKDPIRPF